MAFAMDTRLIYFDFLSCPVDNTCTSWTAGAFPLETNTRFEERCEEGMGTATATNKIHEGWKTVVEGGVANPGDASSSLASIVRVGHLR